MSEGGGHANLSCNPEHGAAATPGCLACGEWSWLPRQLSVAGADLALAPTAISTEPTMLDLLLELIATPCLAWWQARIANRAQQQGI